MTFNMFGASPFSKNLIWHSLIRWDKHNLQFYVWFSVFDFPIGNLFTSKVLLFLLCCIQTRLILVMLTHLWFGFYQLRTQALASLHSGLQNNQGIPVSQVAKWLGMEVKSLGWYRFFSNLEVVKWEDLGYGPKQVK